MAKIKVILWDFDGVILDSMAVRDWGFREIFKDFPSIFVDNLILYHRANGGLSRYIKIRYFFEQILGESINEEDVINYAQKFSLLMRRELTNPKNLIENTLEYIINNYKQYNFHIVSGSDGEELRFLCKELELSSYFKTIEGSPTSKKELVFNLIKKYDYNKDDICLIGDSFNDFEAASENEILFFGFNNKLLRKYHYIESFKDFIF